MQAADGEIAPANHLDKGWGSRLYVSQNQLLEADEKAVGRTCLTTTKA